MPGALAHAARWSLRAGEHELEAGGELAADVPRGEPRRPRRERGSRRWIGAGDQSPVEPGAEQARSQTRSEGGALGTALLKRALRVEHVADAALVEGSGKSQVRGHFAVR